MIICEKFSQIVKNFQNLEKLCKKEFQDIQSKNMKTSVKILALLAGFVFLKPSYAIFPSKSELVGKWRFTDGRCDDDRVLSEEFQKITEEHTMDFKAYKTVGDIMIYPSDGGSMTHHFQTLYRGIVCSVDLTGEYYISDDQKTLHIKYNKDSLVVVCGTADDIEVPIEVELKKLLWHNISRSDFEATKPRFLVIFGDEALIPPGLRIVYMFFPFSFQIQGDKLLISNDPGLEDEVIYKDPELEDMGYGICSLYTRVMGTWTREEK